LFQHNLLDARKPHVKFEDCPMLFLLKSEIAARGDIGKALYQMNFVHSGISARSQQKLTFNPIKIRVLTLGCVVYLLKSGGGECSSLVSCGPPLTRLNLRAPWSPCLAVPPTDSLVALDYPAVPASGYLAFHAILFCGDGISTRRHTKFGFGFEHGPRKYRLASLGRGYTGAIV
jgi:hypothetical protein